MKRYPVKSETVASVGYDHAKRELAIEFRNHGDVYLYFDVPPEEYADFLAAESKGTYLNRIFKPRAYAYKVVRTSQKSFG